MKALDPFRGAGDSVSELLDLFGGAQGCGVGYARAGFRVTSVDIEPHDKHPEVAEFIQADAMEVLMDMDFLDRFDVVHASPPCQASTTMSNRWRGKGGVADGHVNLIPDVRNLLEHWDGVFVIENVPGARKSMIQPFTLHGGMFGLNVYRPRLFESPVKMCPPPAPKPANPVGVYGALDGRRLFTRKDGTVQRAARTLDEGREAMGIDWMEWHDLTEAIPPAYTEWIGRRLMQYVTERAA